jgi:hypothetical protein
MKQKSSRSRNKIFEKLLLFIVDKKMDLQF